MFRPERVVFEKEALDYSLGRQLYQIFQKEGFEIRFATSHNRITGVPGKDRRERFIHAKHTLVVGVRRGKDLASCRPSAHYQLPLVTGCPGFCEYCYLFTNLAQRPYVRIYVNIEEILTLAEKYSLQRSPEITFFEGAATSDPLAVEKYSGALEKAILFFAVQPMAMFRFVTKYTCVESLLHLNHKKRTRFRFSVNSQRVVQEFEHGVPVLAERLQAAEKVAAAGYPLGFMIAPIIATDDWRDDYAELFRQLKPFNSCPDLTFEFVTHRFTPRAREAICELFPKTGLPLTKEGRRFKWGQFGYGKYVYEQELFREMEAFFRDQAASGFPGARVDYFV